MMAFRASGVYAALATPIRDHGEIDYDGVDRVLELVLEAGVDGVCIAGATGEYVHFSAAERAALAAHVAGRLGGRGTLLVAIGASSTARVLELGRDALDAGSDALLLPMPYFFRYEQDDLEAFCREVPARLQAPCLLYNLPGFTNPLDVELSARLLNSEPYLVGIKDSSGDRAALTRLAAARGSKPFALLAGNDEVIEAALAEGWDGTVSGIASFCPELIVALYRALRRGESDEIRHVVRRLDELIEQIVQLPTPWAIRAGLEVRGIPMGPYALPFSPRRAGQIVQFHQWFRGWLNANLDEMRQTAALDGAKG
jgi:4-hydroxy-tetrahydrodipicolinate synthase